MIDLKVLTSVLTQLEDERGISRSSALHAIEEAFAHAYKKEYGKRGQIVRCHFSPDTGATTFEQIKLVVDEDSVRFREEGDEEHEEEKPKKPSPMTTGRPGKVAVEPEEDEEEKLPYFDPEKHMMLEDAQKIKKGAVVDDEIVFPLDTHEDFGRIAAQTAKQVLIQNIREAEKSYLSEEYGKREGEVVTGSVQRIERGNIFVDLGRATGLLPYEEQIPGERYKQGERVRAYLYRVEETPRGVFLKLSRSHPAFLEKLFEQESPEVANEVVEIRAIAREAGSRSKIAVWSNDDHIDPVGSLVGQRGVRVSTVMSELGGEKIDIVEYSEEPTHFIEDSLSPAKVVEVEITDEEEHQAVVKVTEDQQSLAIGRGGQNVRLAAKLTGWRIDIQSMGGEDANEEGEETPETADVPEEEVEKETEKEVAEEKPKKEGEESKEDEEPTEEKAEE